MAKKSSKKTAKPVRPQLGEGVETVSYTHLDVYKRQLSQGVLIALMFLGRVGVLTLIYAAFGSNPAHSRLPQEKIAIG